MVPLKTPHTSRRRSGTFSLARLTRFAAFFLAAFFLGAPSLSLVSCASAAFAIRRNSMREGVFRAIAVVPRPRNVPTPLAGARAEAE